MDPLVGFGLLLLVVLAIVTFMSTRDRKNKERIDTEIRRVGGEPVEISFQFVGYDRDNQHYNVRFADVLGRKHETRCKVNIWQGNLFWQRTPAELLSDLPVKTNVGAGSGLMLAARRSSSSTTWSLKTKGCVNSLCMPNR